MEILRLDALTPLGWPRPVVAVGNFDGVHRGHQALIAATVAQARERAGTAAVLTFDPHPARVIAPERAPATLMTLDQKAEVLAALAVDRMVVLDFTPELSRQRPEGFAREVLGRALQAELVVVGSNFRFGRDRQGDVGALAALGDRLGFAVEIVPPVLQHGSPVSSMRIRDALARGEVEEARVLLGRPFFIDGEVVRGAGRGRQLGVPTANLRPFNETIPAGGVYAARCRPLEGNSHGTWAAVVNIGRRPTFGETTLTVEAHLLDRQADLYGRRLRLEFAARLRDEQAFAGPAALVQQIQSDIAEARRVLAEV
ncbi:MAG TPA: bifunctional riboflavin kinase/FAD synthetase [Vicinamibacteria bacterium]|jgi:riboflavin kinase/FMN adenylyltransferase|nr:bifunctional riboflavin kinase/FAD synthetase [Vicinamibacteria bacterium]